HPATKHGESHASRSSEPRMNFQHHGAGAVTCKRIQFAWNRPLIAVLLMASAACIASGTLPAESSLPASPAASGLPRTAVQQGENDLWRTQSRCGINSLYVLMRLLDTDV